MPVPRHVPDHGTRARYVSRSVPCRCERCRAANTRYIAVYRARTTPTVRPEALDPGPWHEQVLW